ncbi:MAG: DUF6647 family protein [Candidatus Binatia bacterium]
MNALMTAIVLWLSANFDLPANFDHPKIAMASHEEMVAMRYGPLHSKAPAASQASTSPGEREVVSVYSFSNDTIYLPEGWTGNTPAEISVLVHELVHHLQNRSGMKFECVQELEGTAYAAQERWLGLYGHDLLTDFDVDAFTLLASTRCIY